MCGIAGVYLLDGSLKVNLDAMLDTMLDAIDHRGGDATGFVALSDEGVVEWQKVSCDARDFAKGRRRVPKGTRTIVAHTRWATLGLPAFMENNHPLKRGSFYAVHNGHISNHHKLLELAGREGYGQVDSEAVPARLASLGKLGALGLVMSEIEGGAAVAAVDETHPKDLVIARGYQSPMFVLRTKKIVLFGSTEQTVRSAYEKHVGKLPRRAKIESLKQGTLLHWKDGTLKRSTFKVYSPPKVDYRLPNVTLPWKDLDGSPKEISQWVRWANDGADDFIACDSCGVEKSWKSLEYVEDEEGFTESLCDLCYSDFVRRTGDSVPGAYEEIPASWEDVNESILAKFLDAEDA